MASLGNLRPHPFLEKLRVRYNHRDDAWIYNQISSTINQTIREQWLVPGDPDPMKFSPMRLFLENIWKETIRGVSTAAAGKNRN